MTEYSSHDCRQNFLIKIRTIGKSVTLSTKSLADERILQLVIHPLWRGVKTKKKANALGFLNALLKLGPRHSIARRLRQRGSDLLWFQCYPLLSVLDYSCLASSEGWWGEPRPTGFGSLPAPPHHPSATHRHG